MAEDAHVNATATHGENHTVSLLEWGCVEISDEV